MDCAIRVKLVNKNEKNKTQKQPISTSFYSINRNILEKERDGLFTLRAYTRTLAHTLSLSLSLSLSLIFVDHIRYK